VFPESNCAMLAMLIGCRLRRGELLALRVDFIQSREGHWVISDLLGKSGHIGTVPIPAWVKTATDEWKNAAGITEGALFDPLTRPDASGELEWRRKCFGGLFWRPPRAGMEKLTPHHLRRSCATLCHRKSSSCSETFRSRERSVTSGASRNCAYQ
jgi:integrase